MAFNQHGNILGNLSFSLPTNHKKMSNITFTNTISNFLLLAILLSACQGKMEKTGAPTHEDPFKTVGINKDKVNSEENNTSEGHKKEGIPQKPWSLKGTWSVKKHHNRTVYAMNLEEVEEWMHRKFIISESITFEFDKMPNYANDFGDEMTCAINNLGQPESIAAEDYFERRFDPIEELDVFDSTLKIYRTTCLGNPFSTFVLTEKNEILTSWDGVYFVLTKDSSSMERPKTSN